MKVVILLLSSLLFAATVEAAQLTLTWTDNSTNETNFQVERCTGASCTSFTLIGAPGANVTTYVDSTVADATTYCYRVRAINSGGSSSYSNTSCATTTTPIPAAPSNLVVK